MLILLIAFEAVFIGGKHRRMACDWDIEYLAYDTGDIFIPTFERQYSRL